MLLKIINNLIVDVSVGIIIAAIKAIARIEEGVKQRLTDSGSRNVFPDYSYGHWERTILWLEDIISAQFSYLESQIRLITILIGLFYGFMAGLLLLASNKLLNLGISSIGITLLSLVGGAVFGIAGGKSLTNRSQIFDVAPDEFKGENFDQES